MGWSRILCCFIEMAVGKASYRFTRYSAIRESESPEFKRKIEWARELG
jgi:hypothetical protein